MEDGQPAGVRIEARMVPFPSSVSDEARRVMAGMVGADGTPFASGQTPIAHDDHAGWAAMREMVGEIISERFRAGVAALGSTAEPITLGGAAVFLAKPAGPAPDDRALIDIHGGALVFGGGEACRLAACLQAGQHRVRCYGVDYRMPPDHPYPAALDDCVNVYRALLDRYAPEAIIVSGGSAGGNLAAALALRARDEGLPLPGALVLISPEVDLTESGDTFETSQLIDVILPRPLMSTNLLYAAGHDLADPYVSPLFGDFTKGFPPTFLQAGTRDLFLSNTARMHRALRRAGVATELHVFEGMPHGGFGGAPEDQELAAEISRFVAEHWPGENRAR